jgi:hypothetical protein
MGQMHYYQHLVMSQRNTPPLRQQERKLELSYMRSIVCFSGKYMHEKYWRIEQIEVSCRHVNVQQATVWAENFSVEGVAFTR